MSEFAQVIVAIATLVSAIASLIVSMRNTRKIEEVHKGVNSKMDQMLAIKDRLSEVTASSAHAAGLEQGRSEERK